MRKNNNFLIYLDNYRRDYLVANVVRDFLTKKKAKVFLTSRKNLKFFAKNLNCDTYIFITNVFNPPPIEIISKIKHKKIIVIDAEGAQTPERCNYFYSHFENIKLNMNYIYQYASKIFVWNNNVKFFLYKNNICKNIENIAVIGSPKLSIAKLIHQKRNDIVKVVGFISRFITINDFLRRSTLERIIDKYFDADQYIYSSTGEVESVLIFLDIIDKILKTTNFKINIRPHPSENYFTWIKLVEKFPDRIFLTDPKEDLVEWLQNVDQVLCTPSTSLVEPIVSGKKIISIHKLLKDNKLNKYYEYSLSGLLEKVHSPYNLEDILSCLVTDKNFMSNNENAFREMMFNYYNFQIHKNYNGIELILDFFQKELSTNINKIGFFNILIYFYQNFLDLIKIKIKKSFNQYNHLEFYDYNIFISNKPSVLEEIYKND